MKWYKPVLIVLLSLLVLIFVVNIGLNWWIARQLPGIINRENNSPHQITYKDLDISLLDRNLKATEIILVPKAAIDTKAGKPGLYVKIESIEVVRFKLWDIIFSDKIVADRLIVNKPDITLLKKNGKLIENPKNIGKDVVAPFTKIIYVSDVHVNRGNIKITEINNSRPILNVSNLSFELEGIFVDDNTLAKTIPFNYKKYLINCDSVYYRMNEFYHVEAENIKTDQNNLVLKRVKLVPEYSRKTFVKSIPLEKDLFAVSVTDISVNKMIWGFKKDDFFFKTQSVVLDDMNANIYRGKMPEDDLSKKKLYNKLLRDLPFEMKVDTLRIKNSKLAYEEEKDFAVGPGILTFSKFNLTATGVASAKGRTKMPDVKIKVDCQFMQTSRLSTDWSFNVLDKSDGFNIKGRIFNFPVERLTAFTKPYMNVEVKGDLDEVYFNFTGNDLKAKGDFAIEYDDLKVSIFRKNDRKKKNKFLSAVANIFVKKDTKEKVKNAAVELDRIPEKSFYNFLWRSIAEGLKKILI